jgi:hypothetical protein
MHFSRQAMDLVDAFGVAARMKETCSFSALAREKNLPRYAKVTGSKFHALLSMVWCGLRLSTMPH